MSIETLTTILLVSFIGVIYSGYIKRNDLTLLVFATLCVISLNVIILGLGNQGPNKKEGNQPMNQQLTDIMAKHNFEMINQDQVRELANRIHDLDFHQLCDLFVHIYSDEELKEFIDEDEGEDLKETHRNLAELLGNPYDIANIDQSTYDALNVFIDYLTKEGTN